MALDKSLWYPEAEQHGYYLEEDGIHRRTRCLGMSVEDVIRAFKHKGLIPEDAELCPELMPFMDGQFLVEVRHPSFPSIPEGANIPIVRIGEKD